ncbi:MAG: S-layer homology domain-containing protein, partial [Oscillospiraceae bacterium]|nr:S-layer homology domain-containing protein [Oscillospiraceae bacterium]
MKRLKRLTALLLVPVMMFAFAPMAFAASEFTDVSPKDWFYAPVNWAVSKGITGGIGNGMFGPNNNCTREQVVTFLWADAGKPDPVTTVSPFGDVRESDWFFKPVMWAVENGITGGVTPTE